ncbi:hypothetical protein GCM10010425_23060 [Streptomyces spororaveus]
MVCWWVALRQAGHDVAMHDIHRSIGLPGTDLLAHVLGEDRDTAEDDMLSAAHSTLYGTYFDRLPAFDAAADLLRELDRRDWRVVLVTSAKDAELGALRRAFDADDSMTATASSEDVSEGKPAPEPVHHALGLADAAAGDSVFVGDIVWDMRAGSRAHVEGVGSSAAAFRGVTSKRPGPRRVPASRRPARAHRYQSVHGQAQSAEPHGLSDGLLGRRNVRKRPVPRGDPHATIHRAGTRRPRAHSGRPGCSPP